MRKLSEFDRNKQVLVIILQKQEVVILGWNKQQFYWADKQNTIKSIASIVISMPKDGIVVDSSVNLVKVVAVVLWQII